MLFYPGSLCAAGLIHVSLSYPLHFPHTHSAPCVFGVSTRRSLSARWSRLTVAMATRGWSSLIGWPQSQPFRTPIPSPQVLWAVRVTSFLLTQTQNHQLFSQTFIIKLICCGFNKKKICINTVFEFSLKLSALFDPALCDQIFNFFFSGSHNSLVNVWKCGQNYRGLELLFSVPVVNRMQIIILINCDPWWWIPTGTQIAISQFKNSCFCPLPSVSRTVLSTVWSFPALVSSWWLESDRSTGRTLWVTFPWKLRAEVQTADENQCSLMLRILTSTMWQCWSIPAPDLHVSDQVFFRVDHRKGNTCFIC